MLLSFRTKNYRSFAEEAGIDLRAATIKEHADTLIIQNGVSVLPVISIYGANASGKSNLFRALKAMQERVKGVLKDSSTMGEETAPYIVPYIFDTQLSSEPTTFEIEISIKNNAYRYGFECTKTQILSEWLFSKRLSKSSQIKEKCLFFRESETLEMPNLTEGVRQKVGYAFQQINHNSLLLTEMKKPAVTPFKDLYYGITLFICTIDCTDEATNRALSQVVGKQLQDDDIKQHIEKLLQTADPAIEGLQMVAGKDADMNILYEIFAVHRVSNGELMPVKFGNESCGTQKLLSIASWIQLCLHAGVALCIDELDMQLHPLLLRHIVKLFTDKSSNPNGAQLIFSSHNLICLDSSDLRRDEIWFVEKNDQKSELYSLADIKSNNTSIRADLDFGKHYLSGRFGAIPFQENGGD